MIVGSISGSTNGRVPSLFGRKVIYSNEKEVTKANVVDVLNSAINTHKRNAAEIDYLHKYLRGVQPILHRQKTHRPEINNKIVENHALEIVDFKKGHVFGEPVQYVRRGEREGISTQIAKLNEFMFAENKSNSDKELAEWFYTCGTAYRMILPDKYLGSGVDDSPFELDTLDPRNTFVIYNSGFGKKPLMGVHFIENADDEIVYSCYTVDNYYEIIDDNVVLDKPHILVDIPIIEYPANSLRLGAFEPVIDMLDAINLSTSNRLDGLEQFVQAFVKFINCRIDEEEFTALKDLGAIQVTGEPGLPADVDIVSSQLDQDQAQISKDDMYEMVLTICSMPGKSKGVSSGGDTGQAIMLRDGWSEAEAQAKDVELIFKQSEKRMLKIALGIIKDTSGDLDLRLSEIDIKFTRNKNANLLVKTQGLQNMLKSGLHPHIAISHCDLFSDPEQVYLDSKPFLAKWLYDEPEEDEDEEGAFVSADSSIEDA